MLRRLAAAAALVGLAAVAGCSDRTEPSAAPLSGESAHVSTGVAQIEVFTFRPTQAASGPHDLARRLRIAEQVLHGQHEPARQLDEAAFEAQLRYRQLARNPSWVPRVIAALPADHRAEARLQVEARQRLRSVLTALSPDVPAWNVAAPAPAADLVRFYKEAAQRYGLDWQLLAAVNFVESAFGKVQGLSTAGAQGPMQFMPDTWRQYGLGGDVHDPHDAILGAANYLHASGAPRDLRLALHHYNPSRAYVDAVLRYARQMHAHFYELYSWQVFVKTTSGDRRVTGPGLP
jgi:membrane-bound lytic murein transglycosylase B